MNDDLLCNLKNRQWLLARLRAEVIGPDPLGLAGDYSQGVTKLTWEEFRGPKRQLNGEEILSQDPPRKRYGAGILYPIGVTDQTDQYIDANNVPPVADMEVPTDGLVDERLEKQAERKAARTRVAMDDSEDYDVTLANAFRPSAIGISFLADLNIETGGIRVEVVSVGRLGSVHTVEEKSANYGRISVPVGNADAGGVGHERDLWLRSPLEDAEGRPPRVEFTAHELLTHAGPLRRPLKEIDPDLKVVVVSRQWQKLGGAGMRLITVSLINQRLRDEGRLDEKCLFQAGIRVSGINDAPWICSYPEPSGQADGNALSDERINRLLYRQYQTFGVGHGCAADWDEASDDRVGRVWTDTLPAYETPATSADLIVMNADGKQEVVRVSMRKLAGLDPDDKGRDELGSLVDAYADWIEMLRKGQSGRPDIPAHLQDTATALISRCDECLARIRDGISFLAEDSEAARHARRAFELANHAMLIAQLRSTREVRQPSSSDGAISWEPPYPEHDPARPNAKTGYWRAFQIAFLLMSLRGVSEPECSDRQVVVRIPAKMTGVSG